MNSQIENDLRRYHAQFTEEHNRLRKELLTQLPLVNQAAQPAGIVHKKRLMRFFLGAVAGTVAAITLWFAFFIGPKTLSAQVLDAFKNAQSVHLVRKIWKDGRWEPSAEIWYRYKNGVREEYQDGNHKLVRLDNGTHQWRYDSNTNLAVRLKSVDPLGHAASAINPNKILNKCKRDPSGDAAVNGRQCRMYEGVNNNSTRRMMVWLDDDNRPLRSKQQILKDGQWIDDVWTEGEYDLSIGTERFQPQFGDGVKIVDSDKFLDERFSLDRAVFVKEIDGHALASSAVLSMRAPAASYSELENPEPSPASVSTRTVLPSCTNSCTPAGTSPTRYSLSLISFVKPIFIRMPPSKRRGLSSLNVPRHPSRLAVG